MASNGAPRLPPNNLTDPEVGLRAPPKRKTSKQRVEESVARRSRTASDGSTFAAFLAHEEKVNPVRAADVAPSAAVESSSALWGRRKRQFARQQKKLTHPPAVAAKDTGGTTGSDLGDVAAMAIASLGNDIDVGEMTGAAQAPPPPPPPASKPKSFRRGHPSPLMPARTLSAQLPTIHDDTAQQYDQPFELPGELTAHRPTRGGTVDRMSSNTIDSLRFSEASNYFNDDVKGVLSQLALDDSMFLSERNDSGFAAQFRTDTGVPSGRDTLIGSSLLDKQSFGSLYRAANHTEPPSSNAWQVSSQQQEIMSFAAMVQSADYGAVTTDKTDNPPALDKAPSTKSQEDGAWKREQTYSAHVDENKEKFEGNSEEERDEAEERISFLMRVLDPASFLMSNVKFTREGIPYFDDRAGWTLAGFIRWLLFNPISPEFTSLQVFCWAVLLGIAMGFYTAFWKEIIEHSVEFMWKELPEALLENGLFTDLDGSFPLYHYMWICPAFWGGVLSYIFVVLPTPIPGQNEWIHNVHTLGVQDSETFFILFLLSTLGMSSGLSLGPELPLVLTAGMIGSWLALRCKQSVLQARVMNITCASAAVGGFFGFPMAGALFVLEIPHRMGLQYFEAISPATIASIVAVLCNRLVTGNDVTGYYSYPFLTTSLPSVIFKSAIVFGLFGALVGTIYARTVLKLKGLVHDFCHAPHGNHADHADSDGAATHDAPQESEKTPLMNGSGKSTRGKTKEKPARVPFHQIMVDSVQYCACCVIPHEPTRAAVAGAGAGALCGLIGMFFPHVMFWGEAQLQTMIDKGRTPLPIFGQEDEPTAALTYHALCLIDPNDAAAVEAGFGMGCSVLITFAKMVVTGLSLGTGIVGGHFWGPLFTGCTASHFLTEFARMLQRDTGFGGTLAAYPCVTMLCTMGSAHVVTFRAHTAIMLILTLTISAFDGDDTSAAGAGSGGAGDYSAVFPLLVVSVFVSLMVSRHTVFYNAQRSRVDIMALPGALCEPGKEGRPMIMEYEEPGMYDDSFEGDGYSDDGTDSAPEVAFAASHQGAAQAVAVEGTGKDETNNITKSIPSTATVQRGRELSSDNQKRRGRSPLPPRPTDKRSGGGDLSSTGNEANSGDFGGLSSTRLDELLAVPIEGTGKGKPIHRRIQSAPDVNFEKKSQTDSGGDPGADGANSRHVRTDSYGSQTNYRRVVTIGQLSVDQPDLMTQARQMSATSVMVESRHVRYPSTPSRSR